MRWNYYKLWQLSLLQSAMDSYYKLRQLFYYKVRWLLQIATMTLGPSLNRGSTVVREKSLEDQNIAGLHPLTGGQVFLHYLWWLKGHTVNSRTNSPVYKAPSFRTIFFWTKNMSDYKPPTTELKFIWFIMMFWSLIKKR